MNKTTIMKYTSTLVAVIVFFGIALHDTKLDKVTKFALALPVLAVSVEVAHVMFLHGDAHTHIEKVSVGKSAARSTAMTPKLPVRLQDGRFHLTQKVPKGHHPFDNYLLPMVS